MQNAQHEEARIALIEELTDQRNAIAETIATKRRQVLRLNQERVTLAQRVRYKEAGDVSIKINGLQREITDQEYRLKEHDSELENARQWRHPRLAAVRLRMEEATAAKVRDDSLAHHDRLRELIGEDHRQAAGGLIATSGEERTKDTILALYGLKGGF